MPILTYSRGRWLDIADVLSKANWTDYPGASRAVETIKDQVPASLSGMPLTGIPSALNPPLFSPADKIDVEVDEEAAAAIETAIREAQLPEYVEPEGRLPFTTNTGYVSYRFTNGDWQEIVNRLQELERSGDPDAEGTSLEVEQSIRSDYRNRPDDEHYQIFVSPWTAKVIDRVVQGEDA